MDALDDSCEVALDRFDVDAQSDADSSFERPSTTTARCDLPDRVGQTRRWG